MTTNPRLSRRVTISLIFLSHVAKPLLNVIKSSINPAITLAGFAVTLDKK